MIVIILVKNCLSGHHIKLLQHVMITMLCTFFHVQQIRVFIFAVGPGRNNHLEWIACDNGGIILCL